MKAFLLILVSVAVVSSKPTGEDDVFGSLMRTIKKCSEEDFSLCLKERALKYVENIASARSMSIFDGLEIISTGSPRSARSMEPLPSDPAARENEVESRMLDAAVDFMDGHYFQLRMPKSTVVDVKRALEEGRGKKKKLKQLSAILGLLQLKIQSLIPLFLAVIAFAAVKGLLLAKAALLASGLVLLKKLLSKHDHHESYEVVAHPHHEEHFSHGGGHGGWGRSADAQDMAYSAHAN